MIIILNESPSYEMEHWNFKMAFTQADLNEKIFMHQPELFVMKENYVCLLKKSLYGLKQAAKNWAEMLRQLFRDICFTNFFSDPCVYFKKIDSAWCFASTHVDDIFVLFNSPGKKLRDELFQRISSKVEIENLGTISWALKTAVQRDRTAGITKISQEAFITEILQKHGVSVPPIPQLIPTYENCFLPKNFQTEDYVADEALKKLYQSQIGALWWLTSISRPDIYYAVHRCSKMQNKPTKALGKCLEKIFLYLASTKKFGLVYQRKLGSPTLSGFVDAAFGSSDED